MSGPERDEPNPAEPEHEAPAAEPRPVAVRDRPRRRGVRTDDNGYRIYRL